MTEQTALCVFCGSSSGASPSYVAAAQSVGRALAAHDRALVYGGGTSGLMGAVAAATLDSGGHVLGVIPRAFLQSPTTTATSTSAPAKIQGQTSSFPISDQNVQIPVDTMHERKQIMAARSAGFIGLPGGYGTLEEISEMTTWVQLGIHRKPVILLSVDGFYDSLKVFIEGAITAGFISPLNRAFLTFVEAPSPLDPSFDWGEAAVAAVEAWEAEGAGGGTQLGLDWGLEQT